MPGGSKTQEVTNSTVPAPYVQEAQQNYLNTAKNFTAPFVGSPPAETVAGLNSNQLYPAWLSREMATKEFTGSPLEYYPVTQAAQPSAAANSGSPALMPPTNAGFASTTNPYGGNAGYATTANPYGGLVNGEGIRALLNPYTKDVVDPTVNLMRRELDKTQNAIRARGASSAAFGGSGAALQSSEANRAFGDQVALTTAKLMSQGYDQATATALANAGRAQEAGMFNAGQTNNMAQFNAARGQEAGMFNAGQTNNMAQYNAGLLDRATSTNQAALNAAAEANAQRQQQTGASNAAAENAMRQFNTNALQSGAGVQNTLANDEAYRQRSALATLLGIGTQEQQTEQKRLDQPMEMLKLLGSSIPGNYGGTSTSTQPDNSPSTLQTLGGLGLSTLGLGTGFGTTLGGDLLSRIFSDERDKTDIKKLGVDPASELPMYAYRYKGDPKNTPKVVGPMAQDIEKKYPGTVREIGGHKVVNVSALHQMLGLGG